MRDLFIVGNRGHAKVVIDILEERGDYNILGIITKNIGDEIGIGIGSYQILGNDNVLQELFNKGVKFASVSHWCK